MNPDEHEDKERNTKHAKEVCEKHNPLMPSGLTLYTSKDAFGLHYHHSPKDTRANTGIRVSLNKPSGIFEFEANDACEVMHRYAKAQESPKVERYGVKTTGYIGSKQKPVKSRLDEEGDVIW